MQAAHISSSCDETVGIFQLYRTTIVVLDLRD